MSEHKSEKPKANSHLILSDDEAPAIKLKPGMRIEVQTVSILDAELKASRPIAARLCGGTTTCLALIELDK